MEKQQEDKDKDFFDYFLRNYSLQLFKSFDFA